MNQPSMQKASIPNPMLKPFGVLIGNWETTGTHPLVPDTILHGRTSFEWLENGAFLLTRSELDHPAFPPGIAIFGSDDSASGNSAAECFMLYFDARGVSRKFQVTLKDNIWKMWRSAPGFSQRFTGTITDGGKTIIGQSELSRDDSTWEKDLELTYRRVE